MAVRSTLQLLLKVDETGTADLGAVPTSSSLLDFYREMTNGVASGMHDLVFADTRTITGNDDLDLAGALAQTFGGTLAAAKIVGLFVRNRSLVAGEKLIVGNAIANQFFSGLFGGNAHTIDVKPSGILVWYSPIDNAVVTAGTGDILRIASGAVSVTYDIIILARSA